ncbi:sigma54 specific transcriptional regulator [Thermacetogenium phaeum DSM 12270]|uniref:Sigma54 specific transcriptional regulator n=1 Tax=Thermacetogenium phaeum (strain ATCC BAA-254 / DSM 26808 / PB) TaxID=1089553 RepID=K4LE80_THEPS|nr:sigma 54-interacting transcriptional regulator [Thermacetogenium phaeum]AFV10382.1 sigma54 specific transcriptional regulator [Thermacetogenium phaeum DSM 12270]
MPFSSVNYSLVDKATHKRIEIRKMTKERWEGILEVKEKFLQNEIGEDELLSCSYLEPEVAKSWIRSRNYGVDHKRVILRCEAKSKFKEKLKRNEALIKIVKPLREIFKNFVEASGYGFQLYDKNGLILLGDGEVIKVKNNVTKGLCLKEGIILNEKNIGTNSHSLCALLRRPVQLIGIENYWDELANTMASAAPIIGEDGEVGGVLLLWQWLVCEPWNENFQRLFSHMLGLVTSIAVAIETQLRLLKSYEELKIANDSLAMTNRMLETTLSLIDDGIITVDRNGKITCVNQEGAQILNLKPDDIGRRNITEFVENTSSFMDLLKKGESAAIEEVVKNKDENYIISIRPVYTNDKNKQINAAVLEFSRAKKVNALVTSRSGAAASFSFDDIVGVSEAITRAKEKAKRFAGCKENILIIGESGTGKELFAQAIHNWYCPEGPFVAVNCAALPRELIESELFGYEGGSFTGADRHGRPGKIELAEGGTLFLDEIGDMPIELQAVLLRVLEDKKVMRVGGRRFKKVDFRVIAATNSDLNKMVREKLFREDLYYRLSVLRVDIPPLRDRGKDKEILARYFIEKYCKKIGRKTPQISPTVRKLIYEYKWPGNVRQLENAVIFAINVSKGDVIEVRDLPDEIRSDFSSDHLRICNHNQSNKRVLLLTEMEKNAIVEALSETKGNIPRAAELLGISKSTVYRKLKEYNISV